MAVEIGQKTITVIQEERTWRIECFCEDGTDYTLRAHREVLTKDQDGNLISQERGKSVSRQVSQITDDPDALQFLQLAKLLCDKWAAE